MRFERAFFDVEHYCLHLNDARVRCESNFHCERCVLADRIAVSTGKAVFDRPLLGYRDTIPQTPSQKGEVWFGKPVLLSSEALSRLGFPQSLRYQVAIAEDGPGVFKHNPVGEIDCVLYVNPTVHFIVTRNECYGMPNERACRLYDSAYPRIRVKKLVEFFDFPPPKPKIEFKKKRRDGH